MNLGLDHTTRVIIAICVFEDTLVTFYSVGKVHCDFRFSIADFRLVVKTTVYSAIRNPKSEIALAFER